MTSCILEVRPNKWLKPAIIAFIWIVAWGLLAWNGPRFGVLCAFAVAFFVTLIYVRVRKIKSEKQLASLVDEFEIEGLSEFPIDLMHRIQDARLRENYLRGALFGRAYQLRSDDLRVVIVETYTLHVSEDTVDKDAPVMVAHARFPLAIVEVKESEFPPMAIYPRRTWNLQLELLLFALCSVQSSTIKEKLSLLRMFAIGGMRPLIACRFYRDNCVETDHPLEVDKFLTANRRDQLQQRDDLIMETNGNLLLIYFRYMEVSGETLKYMITEAFQRFKLFT